MPPIVREGRVTDTKGSDLSAISQRGLMDSVSWLTEFVVKAYQRSTEAIEL